jgi:uncharacterized protein YdhG (YjbR/CyaY superfamily)
MASKKGGKDAERRSSAGFTAEERAAMKERVQEMRGRAAGSKVDGEAEVRKAIAKMAPSDRILAEKVHEIVRATAPELTPRTWYGMPAYARGKDVVCFFQNAGKFKVRYATLGFSDEAKLDDGRMWPVTYALTELTSAEEARIVALVKQAVS